MCDEESASKPYAKVVGDNPSVDFQIELGDGSGGVVRMNGLDAVRMIASAALLSSSSLHQSVVHATGARSVRVEVFGGQV